MEQVMGDTPSPDRTEPSAEAPEAAPWCRDAWFVLTTVGDGEATTLHHGWAAIKEAVVGVHYFAPDPAQYKEVMGWFLDWEEWSNAPDGYPWRWEKHYEDGSVLVWRVTNTLALDRFRAAGVREERERCISLVRYFAPDALGAKIAKKLDP
jgi:hypothetical protein